MNYTFLANYIVNDLLGLLRKKRRTIQDCGIDPGAVSALCQLIQDGEMTKAEAKVYLEAIIDGKD